MQTTGIQPPLHSVHSSLLQTILIWSFLVNTTQFHTRGTFWISMLIMQSDTLKVVFPASHLNIPLNSDPLHTHIFNFLQALLPPHLHKGVPELPGILGHSSLLWPPDSGEKLREGSPKSGSPDTIMQGPGITGLLKNLFKH